MELQQQQRLREIQKRFKSEHEGRTSAETELAQLREQRQAMEQQVGLLTSWLSCKGNRFFDKVPQTSCARHVHYTAVTPHVLAGQ